MDDRDDRTDTEARAQAGVASAVGTAYNACVQSKTSLWICWAHNAARSFVDAQRGRARLIAGRGGPDSTVTSRALADEHEAALASVCAAVFAMEALSRSLQQLVQPNRRDRQPCPSCKSRTSGDASSQLRRILHLSVCDGRVAASLAERWKPLITLRSEAVHYVGELEPTTPHPSGIGNTSVDTARFSYERAEEALTLLTETLVQLQDDPTPAAAVQAQSYSQLIGDLRAAAASDAGSEVARVVDVDHREATMSDELDVEQGFGGMLGEDQQGVPLTGAELAAYREKYPAPVRTDAEKRRLEEDVRKAKAAAARRDTAAAAEQLRRLLAEVDAGRVEASDVERAYLAGALGTLDRLTGRPPIPTDT